MTEAMQTLIASDQTYVVMGLGETGVSVIAHLFGLGKSIVAFDSRNDKFNLDELRADFPGVEFVQSRDALHWIGPNVTWVVSPGVALSDALVVEAREAGSEILGDLDLFMQAAGVPVVGITGSNGKSTVTTLVAQMLQESGFKAAAGGNLSPAALTLLNDGSEMYVIEMSSFQLERSHNLGLDVAAVLNITPDHLDRHGSMPLYHAAKHRIFRGAKAAVINDDDPLTNALVDDTVRVIRYGTKTNRDLHFRLADGAIWMGESKVIDTSRIALQGYHNIRNALAACAIAYAMGAKSEGMSRALARFTGLPHRCEHVAEDKGIVFINDSKATNVGSTLAAIEGIGASGRLIVLLGGVGKGQSFEALREPVNRRAKAVVVFGAVADELAGLGFEPPVHRAEDLRQALAMARSQARSGDTVLLSPACASFDQFQNYVDRGETFCKLVREGGTAA